MQRTPTLFVGSLDGADAASGGGQRLGTEYRVVKIQGSKLEVGFTHHPNRYKPEWATRNPTFQYPTLKTITPLGTWTSMT